MILERHRATLLDLFPPALPLLVLAPVDAPLLVEQVAARGRPAVTACFGSDGRFGAEPDAAIENLLLEGLDAVDDPQALLRRIRDAVPQARMFALVSNAASLTSLANFVAGAPLAAAHPLVREELEPLFAAGGYAIVRIDPLTSTLMNAEQLRGGLRLQTLLVADLTGDEELRVRTDAFLIVADPQP